MLESLLFACCLENPIRVGPSRFWQTGSNTGLIGNDGALKAAGTAAPLTRIRFLWSSLSVPTSDNPPVKRPGCAKTALEPGFPGKCGALR